MKKILIATNNKGKISEILEVVGDLAYEFVSLADLDISDDVEESASTYEGNARIKSEFFGEISGLPTIADDSGIVVEALSGELGVKTRRWGAGEHASDDEWLEYFLNRMEDEENRRAEFFSSICFFDGKDYHTFNGSCKGVLLKEKKCESISGIPLSSIFVPDGYDKPYSLLGVEEKNKISHRGKASLGLLDYLKNKVFSIGKISGVSSK